MYRFLLLLLVTNGKMLYTMIRWLGWLLGKRISMETSSEFSYSLSLYEWLSCWSTRARCVDTSFWLLVHLSRVKVIWRSLRKLVRSRWAPFSLDLQRRYRDWLEITFPRWIRLTLIVFVLITLPTSNRKRWRLDNVLQQSTWSIDSPFVPVTKREKTKPIPLELVLYDSNMSLWPLRTKSRLISWVKIRSVTSTRLRSMNKSSRISKSSRRNLKLLEIYSLIVSPYVSPFCLPSLFPSLALSLAWLVEWSCFMIDSNRQQVPHFLHGWTHCESVPYLQRFLDFRSTTQEYSKRRFSSRQDPRLQPCESTRRRVV